ncbi:MAG: ATP-binding protein [Hyalangium sp.]
MLPVVVFSALVVLQLASQMQSAIELRLQRSAQMMTLTFDREISASIRTLQALAESASLDTGELEHFRAEAERVWKSQPSWLTVILLTPEGQQLVNLRRPREAPQVRVTEPESLRRTVETLQPIVGDFTRSPATGEWAFPIRVPVLRDGQLRYVLTAVIPAEALADIVAHQQSVESGELTRTLVDSQGTVAFRTLNPERFVGRPATLLLREHMEAAPEGVFRGITLEGLSSYVAYRRSALSGWTSSVGIPVETIDAPFRRSLLAIASSGVLTLLVSAAGAFFFSRRFARGIRSLASAAQALAHGEQPLVAASAISEVDRVGSSLELSAQRLHQHAQEEQRAREGLEQAVRARDEFLSLASHELKTPLTSLMLQTQLLQRRLERGEPLPPAAARKLLDQTARQTQRLARLVNDMLDISRISAGKLSLERETFDLVALASEVVVKLGPQLSEAHCQVSIRAEGPVVGVWDQYRLEQVLTNLLTNAARYGAGTPVELSVRRLEGQAELRVSDQGRGIAQADQERIFRKFERAVGGHEVSGLGLGLFIVQEIVQMHGGTVRIQSELGQGATFIVLLPTAEGSGEGSAQAGVSEETPG